jgi:DNA-binding transcriptional regulator YhcF (GntR family)
MRTPAQDGAKTDGGGSFGRANFVMYEKDALLLFSKMMAKKPRAASLFAFLTANMGDKNALVINQRLIAKMMGVSTRTVQYALAELVERNWVEVVHLHGPGSVAAYVVNSNVAWAQPRSELCYSTFSAEVIADFEDQPKVESKRKLNKMSREAIAEMMALDTEEASEPDEVSDLQIEVDQRQTMLFEAHE